MEEIENFSEQIHEQSNEHAHHLAQEGKERWVIFVAMTTAIIAVLAAIAGLLAGTHADDAMLSQIKASDQWAYYQAKGIKADVIASTGKVLTSLGKQPLQEDLDKIKENKKQQTDIKEKAEELQKESDAHLEKHGIFAHGVTMFQIAIAIGAISIIVKRKALWLVSIGFACVGVYFLFQGFLF